MNVLLPPNRRILLVDDNLAIHDDFRRILMPTSSASTLDAEAASLFGAAADVAPSESVTFQLDYAQQGQEACEKAAAAVAAGCPYALAFVDMRMPPGWDGLTTIAKLWEIDPEVQVVICTAYSDRSWNEIQAALTARDRWLVLKKPFDKVEVLQLAQALTEKWHLTRLSRLQLATLEKHVAVRTDQLRHAVQVKNEFLANITHELLTPLHGIMGSLALMSEDALNADQASSLADVRTCAESLNRLLQQIVAFNQAEAGTLALDPLPCSPGDLLTPVANAYRARARLKGIALRTQVAPSLPAVLRAPAPVIRQILTALTDNALKFTECGAITMHVGGEPDLLCFTVEDTGIGMTAEQLSWVGLPFAQVDGGLARRQPGIGLGLPLAKRLATSLGGELTLSSQPGRGTTATFTARAAPLQSTAPALEAAR
ncbi:ATP-binding protein [Opitutus terrae]|uniref:histidine kinase n=1 Tax=Opitutus terrae (strain DSM 11246 / JCM 15787 / PB90-1) TaxID=452637 RepID=B1ZVL3_OPITP|nr:ATP-binding protein [Opitutus terrae]ACB74110.1 response regulator receiver sensor signal transduction histidine kinase [Opitutus terrae PB90-1]